MPCPFTGPKMFCADPNKIFVPAKRLILLNAKTQKRIVSAESIFGSAVHFDYKKKTSE